MNIVRNNPLISFSIILPLVVVALFSAATLLPRLFVDPPAYNFVFTDETTRGREAPFNLEFSVADDKVVARVSPLKPGRMNTPIPRLYLFDQASTSVREINLPLPDTVTAAMVLDIPELAGFTTNGNLHAPDGYEFRGNTRRSGLVGSLFGGSRAQSSITIAKDGLILRVQLPATGDYYRVRFLGWLVDTTQIAPAQQ